MIFSICLINSDSNICFVQYRFYTYTCMFLPTECDEGTFGYNCTSPCHCLDSTPCNHINGSCPGDLCAPGWKRKNCSVGMYKCIFSLSHDK